MKDKIFYSFIIKHFQEQLHNYFMARIPEKIYAPGDELPLNKRVNVTGAWSVDKNGVLMGKTTTKHFYKGYNACIKEMQSRIIKAPNQPTKADKE